MAPVTLLGRVRLEPPAMQEFLSGLFVLVATVFFFRFVPETKGKSLEEIERSWNR